MSKNFHIINHAKEQLIKRGIIPSNYSCKEIQQFIYNQCISDNVKIYTSLRSTIYIYNNVEYVFNKNTLITSIVH
jgi:hypothetical protein